MAWTALILLRPNPARGGVFLLLICIFISLKISLTLLSFLILLVYLSGILVILLYLTNLVSNYWVSLSKPVLLRFVSIIIWVFFHYQAWDYRDPRNFGKNSAFYLLSLTLILGVLFLVLILLLKILNTNFTVRNF